MSLPTRIRVVPHFMRLHEWVALEESHYRAEGLDPELLSEVTHRVSSHAGDPYFERTRTCPSSPEEWRSRTRPASGLGVQCRGRDGQVRARPIWCRALCALRSPRIEADTARRPGRRSGGHGTDGRLALHDLDDARACPAGRGHQDRE